MTEQLEKSWKDSQKPFHDETIYTDDLVPIGALRQLVSSILGHIEQHYRGNPLFLFDDWHAHDGFVVEAAPVSIKELRGHVETTESLYDWRHGDHEVHRAIYPDTLEFLLRVQILDADEDPELYPGVWGAMSFTGYGIDLHEIDKRNRGITGISLARANSKEYFDRIYAG